jgi:hypothetical protein
MTAEEWRPIPGFPGYEVSNFGRVLSRKRKQPRLLAPPVDKDGYLYVRLCRDGVASNRPIHQLVPAAFIGPRPAGAVTRHLDGDKLNNHLSNLTYGTWAQNNLDTVAHGRHWCANKTHCANGHPFSEANTYGSGQQRRCRTCSREETRARRARKRAEAAA